MQTFQQFIEARISNPEIEEGHDDWHTFYYIAKKLDLQNCVILGLKASQLVAHLVSQEQKLYFDTCIRLLQEWLHQPYKVNPLRLLRNANNLEDGPQNPSAVLYWACIIPAAEDKNRANSYLPWACDRAINIIPDNKNKLIQFAGFLLKKEEKHNNFNKLGVDANTLSSIKKLIYRPFTQISEHDLYLLHNALIDDFDIEEGDFSWDKDDEDSVYNNLAEKGRLIMTIRREFEQI